MTWKSKIREVLEKVGLHVTRQSENPTHTMLGLRQIQFGTILDVGANEGQFARVARRIFPQAKIYCFEPTLDAYKTLEEWGCKDGNVHTFKVALGDMAGELEMSLHSDHTPSSSFLQTTNRSHELYPFTVRQNKIKVQIVRLDDFIINLAENLKAEILIKLDVQGYELPVLKGAENTLRCAKACIIEVTIDDFYQGQSTFAEVSELLHQSGLRYAGNINQVYGVNGQVLYLDALFIR